MKRVIYSISIVIMLVGFFYGVMPSESVEVVSNDLLTLAIQTSNGTLSLKKEYQQGSITLTSENGTIIYMDNPMDIRARGNSTLSFAKKSYKLKFDRKVSLLTNHAKDEKEWVLLALAKDATLLRNELAFSLGRVLTGISYVPDSQYVHVSVNDLYMGVYQLCDQIESGYGRVEIDTGFPALDAGFLVTIDTLASGMPYMDYFQAEHKYAYVTEVYTQEQGERIASIVANAEQVVAIGVEEEIGEIIDLPSCIDMYLLQEFALNYDVGWASFYLYAHRGEEKLYFGPPWDFDIAFGNDTRLLDGDSEGLFVGSSEYEQYHTNMWYYHLAQYEWFQEAVYERWNEVKEALYAQLVAFETEAMLFLPYLEEDATSTVYTTSLLPGAFFIQDDREAIEELIHWNYNRYEWLDEYITDHYQREID